LAALDLVEQRANGRRVLELLELVALVETSIRPGPAVGNTTAGECIGVHRACR
jgi:hypothetical protein